ncbi:MULTISPECIES: asparagine synthetase B [unclassified Undibacterium]|uniref:asparagine synthetase B family protein n=2 Tax=Oxalobacteraceae TaxID=75682 RepID=UPI002AC9AB75|nr:MULTISPECIES: asparagine synthetase B [unclassified Undibacterium]MEB0140577.1 asparagine synthetase B [Undibacterium sp. CCC2.1]MEB0173631.1 asparagine synthetase B [Undibacterium sp. CCC1.1]MEB0177343.1 asparagine synthetase B [Undibacterium sp. CCC3.4]MEB0216754.1 asparagine synthetase B [Undibacterium sp. 5I2]WPX44566.1 asparagine synthetase B [Undibacterium sp. CCC3.4]
MALLLFNRTEQAIDARFPALFARRRGRSAEARGACLATTDTPPLLGAIHCANSGCELLAWLRIDNRSALAAELGLPVCLDNAHSDGQLLLAAYARWQEGCVARLIGDFAFALYDPQRETVLLARDPLGVRPLYYRLDPDLLAVALSPAALLHLPDRQAQRDMDWAARFLLRISQSHTATGYREIKKLPPGHLAVLNQTGYTMRAYFSWRDDAPTSRRLDPHWLSAYREQLEQALACRLDAQHPIGCENSGGIDSATITGLAAQLAGAPRIHSFGIAMQEQEASHIDATIRMHGIEHQHLLSGFAKPDDDTIDHMLTVLGYPAEHGNAYAHFPFYQLCRQFGVTTLLSGFGGDEAVTNPGHHLFHELLDQGDWRNLYRLMPGNPLTRSLRLAKRLLTPRRASNDESLQTVYAQRWAYQPLHLEVVEQLDLAAAYMDSAIDDAPYRRINDFVLQNRLVAAFIPTRLENCSLLAALYGVEYRWPLLDVRLIQQYLSTPSLEKFGPGGMGRYLHRRAMEGIAPPMVQWKRSKDMGLDTWLAQQLQTQNLQAVARQLQDELERLPTALENLVDIAKLRRTAQNLTQLQGSARNAAWVQLRSTTSNLQWLRRWLLRVE